MPAARAAVATLGIGLVFGALAACGDETPQGDGPPPSAADEWTEQLIRATPGADSPTGFAADGADVLVVVLDEDGTLWSHLSSGGGDFVAGEPFDTDGGGYPGFADPVRLDGTWWLVGAGGRVGTGNDEELAFEPRVLRSEDGLAWEAVEVSGIDAPVELNGIVAAEGGLVAVGTRRPADPVASEGFTAVAFRSEDGSAWTETSLPDVVADPSYAEESHVSSVAVTGDRLVAAGGLAQHGVVWLSDDSGRTWARVTSEPLDQLSAVSGLASDGSQVLVSGTARGSEGGSLVVVSEDRGATWERSSEQPAQDGEGYAPLWSGGGRYFTVSRPGMETMGDPAVCYADLEACSYGGEEDVTLVHLSDDGHDWSVLDLSDAASGDGLVGVAGDGAGRVLLASLVRDGIAVSSWPPGAVLPEAAGPSAPERVDLVTVPAGEEPGVGVRYHAPLYVHCGMGWLYLGDRPWQRTDGGPEVETGAGDDLPGGWPVAGQTIYGFVTLTAAGVVEYSVGNGDDARVIATYEQTGVQPPGCD